MSKINRLNEHHMRTAVYIGSMSKAVLRKVGVVFVKDKRSIVDGWNGTLPGTNNCCEETRPCLGCGRIASLDETTLSPTDDPNEYKYVCACGRIMVGTYRELLSTKNTVIHAEENAVIYAAKHGISLEGCSVYTSTAPCVKCARMLVGVGISKLYYLNTFKNDTGLELLLNHGVKLHRMYPPGKIPDKDIDCVLYGTSVDERKESLNTHYE